jgi:hypothetical protein
LRSRSGYDRSLLTTSGFKSLCSVWRYLYLPMTFFEARREVRSRSIGFTAETSSLFARFWRVSETVKLHRESLLIGSSFPFGTATTWSDRRGFLARYPQPMMKSTLPVGSPLGQLRAPQNQLMLVSRSRLRSGDSRVWALARAPRNYEITP